MDDDGTGLLGTTTGVLAVVAFLLFATHLLLGLTTTTLVNDAAHAAAARVASARVDHTDPESVARARVDAEATLRASLGRFGERVTVEWSAPSPDAVTVRVHGQAERFLLPGLGGNLGIDRIDRTATVRVERTR